MSEESESTGQGRSLEQLSAELARLEGSPDDPAANRRAGWILGKLQRYPEALGHLSKAAEADPEHAGTWYYLAVAANHTGDRETALHASDRFDRLAPEDARALAMRANLHLRLLGEPERALEYARRALELEPTAEDRPWIHFILAACYKLLGNRKERLRHLEEVVRLDPEDSYALAELAHVQYELQQPVTVVPEAERLVDRRPEDPEAWYTLGAVANRYGDFWRARDALERAISLGYDNSLSRRELGRALCEIGSHREGIVELEKALLGESEPSDRAWIQVTLGGAYRHLKDQKQALEHYRAAVEADPDSAHAQQSLGATYAAMNEHEAAVPHLEEAVRLAPEEAHAWYALGRVLAWIGHLDRAREALERAVTLGHKDGEARAQLAWVYQQQGEYARAAELAKRALRQPLPRKWRSWVAGIVRDCQRPRK